MIKETLEWVNKVRKDLGRRPITELKKGVRFECRNCPITNSLGGQRGKYTISTGVYYTEVKEKDLTGQTRVFHLSDAASDFRSKFDGGSLPELET